MALTKSPKSIQKVKLTVRTADKCVHITVPNWSTQYSSEQFWQSSLLPPYSHQSSAVVYWRGGQWFWNKLPTQQTTTTTTTTSV